MGVATPLILQVGINMPGGEMEVLLPAYCDSRLWLEQVSCA